MNLPLTMSAHGLGQRGLEAGFDMLGIDETDWQAARQGVQEGLHGFRPTERSRQQPYLGRRFTGMQRAISQQRR